jgi:hypothetical protein
MPASTGQPAPERPEDILTRRLGEREITLEEYDAEGHKPHDRACAAPPLRRQSSCSCFRRLAASASRRPGGGSDVAAAE